MKPADPDPEGGFALLRFLAELLLGDPGQNDKIGHFVAYAALAGNAALSFRARWIAALLLSFSYGLMFEAIQAFLPDREGLSGADLLANGLGVLAGGGAALLAVHVFRGVRP